MAEFSHNDEQQQCAAIGELVTGTIVAATFTIISKLGSGGKATVFLARNEKLDDTVAIKFWHAYAASTATIHERFRREGQITASLNHENIVRVKTLGAHDGIPYLVMEFVPGISLEEYISTNGALSDIDTQDLFRAVSSALQYAHENKVLHRDIKPANIMLTNSCPRTPKIVDFGLARICDKQSDKQHLTVTAAGTGSPAYMSPEQCKGEKVDVRTDIYSLGATMFHATTGQVPFHAESDFAVMAMHLNTAARFLPGCTICSELQAVILKCMNKDPADRYQTAQGLVDALSDIETNPGQTSDSRQPLQRGHRPRLSLAAIGVVILAIATLGWFAYHRFYAQQSSALSLKMPASRPLVGQRSTESLVMEANTKLVEALRACEPDPNIAPIYELAIEAAKNPDSLLFARSNYANYLREQGNLPGAQAEMKKAFLQIDSLKLGANTKQLAYRFSGKIEGERPDGFRDAEKLFIKSIMVAPANSELYEDFAHLYRNHGHKEKAVEYFRKSLDAENNWRDNARKWIIMAELTQEKDPKHFEEYFRKYLGTRNDEVKYTEPYLCNIASVFAKNKQLERALKVLKYAVDDFNIDKYSNPRLMAQILLTSAEVNAESGNLAEANRSCDKLINHYKKYLTEKEQVRLVNVSRSMQKEQSD